MQRKLQAYEAADSFTQPKKKIEIDETGFLFISLCTAKGCKWQN